MNTSITDRTYDISQVDNLSDIDEIDELVVLREPLAVKRKVTQIHRFKAQALLGGMPLGRHRSDEFLIEEYYKNQVDSILGRLPGPESNKHETACFKDQGLTPETRSNTPAPPHNAEQGGFAFACERAIANKSRFDAFTQAEDQTIGFTEKPRIGFKRMVLRITCSDENCFDKGSYQLF